MKKIKLIRIFRLLTLLSFAISISSTANAQFKNKKNKQGVIDDDGGIGLKDCYSPGESFPVGLFLTGLAVNNEVDTDGDGVNDEIVIGWGCDLYIGVTSPELDFTTFIYASNAEDYSFIDINPTTWSGVDNVIFGQFYGVVPQVPSSKIGCKDGVYELTFTMNLYCKVGDEFIPVDACENEDYFHMDFLDGCSLESELGLKICCNERPVPEIPDPETTGPEHGRRMMESESSNNVSLNKLSGEGFEYEVRNFSEEKLKFYIFDLSGIKISEGELQEVIGIHYHSLERLETGMYILSIVDGFGIMDTKKFFKL